VRWVEDVTHRMRGRSSRPVRSDPVESSSAPTRLHKAPTAGPLRHGYAVAERMHEGQMRKSGEAYITHPLAVAQILAELGMDTTTLVAALLHDTVEDTSYTMEQLHGDFGARWRCWSTA
jgi:GTP pyrophosphokinase